MRMLRILPVLAASVLAAGTLSGCQTMQTVQDNPKTTAGTVIGGVGGAFLGNQFGGGSGKVAMTVIGGLAGAYLGHEIGSSLDAADRTASEKAAERALEGNRTATWANPDSGRRGEIQPTNTYTDASGRTCREYQTTVYIDGQKETATRRACQSTDGRWRDVEA